MDSTGELFIFLRLVLGEGWGLSGRRKGASSARIEWALGRGQKTTYGRSSKKPTVGRSTDLPWVAKTTYRWSYFGGARRRCLDGLESGVKTELAFPRKAEISWAERTGGRLIVFRGWIASSFPWKRAFRTAVALGRGVCIGAKLVEAFGGLRNYYYLCSAQAESRAVHGGCSSVG